MIFPLDYRQPEDVYNKAAKKYVVLVLILQAIAIFLRLTQLSELFSALMMMIVAGVGYYALREDLSIFYVSVWGSVCFAFGIYDVFTGVLVALLKVVTLQVSEALMEAVAPLAELLGAALAWQIFKDHEARGGTFSFLFKDGNLDQEALKGAAGQAAVATMADSIFKQQGLKQGAPGNFGYGTTTSAGGQNRGSGPPNNFLLA
eukprot:TRINITY_DN56075_c0_g1_i1.p1 TRINITY_DN56075_c0_g1~~TRINITY_DN56075_c0_g1_i1.p1  ORF type:complete len:203 (+),score=44.43 TRINITY_DN56075_c0_g1_i1:57-665(+)